MELNRDSAIPLWYQIAEILGREISNDVHRAGRQFPTESLLTGRFGVNRHTVRHAVSSLADQGLVRVEKGRGTFVEDHVIDYRIGKRTRFSANLLLGDVEPGHRLIRATELPATNNLVLRSTRRYLDYFSVKMFISIESEIINIRSHF